MKESNPFWQPIQSALSWSRAKSVFNLVAISVLFPVVECVFVNLWTASPPQKGTPFLVVLISIVVLHVAFGLMAIIEEIRNRAETVLPKAFQLEEDSEKLQRELDRRKMTNTLVRVAFDQLNLQSCAIEFSPPANAWCLGGFANGLAPILSPFLEQMDSTLGVRGSRFSIEIYFTRGAVPIQGARNDCHRNLSQLAFYSSHVDHCTAVCMDTRRSPAQIGFDARTAFEQHIESNKQLFYENGNPVESIYFRRYATCPINENCGEMAEGVLVLTSMQDEPFADDVLETLAFLATITSNYLSAYRRCYQKHNSGHQLTATAVPAPHAPKLQAPQAPKS